jgi:hypothetical protein
MYPPGMAPSDQFINLVFRVLLVALAVVVALPGVAVFAVAYTLATRRGWRWWTLALPGAALILGVVGAGWALTGDPTSMFTWHALGLRELFANTPHGPALRHLAGAHWATWVLHETPLSLGAALVGAGAVVDHIGSTPGHELSYGAQRRRARHATHVADRARNTASNAPLSAGRKAEPVLGAWIDGDLHPWHTGRWATLPASALGLGGVLLGVPGAGKTETLLRLAEVALAQGVDVHVIDAKGDPAGAARFAGLCAAHGVTAKLFPTQAYDGWRGQPDVLRNRLGQIIDYTEPFYEDGAGDILDAILTRTAGPPRSFRSLVSALEAVAGGQVELKGIDRKTRQGTLSRYRRFAATAAGTLDGTWAFEDARASYVLLDGLTLGKDAPRLARYLVEDFAHYATSRKPPGRRTLLLIDEFSALRLPNAAAKFEKLRSFGAAIIVAAQSPEGLHDDPREADRLLNTAGTILAHRIVDPDPIVTRAGTIRRAERSHQLDGAAATGAGSLRMQDAYRIDPNDLRSPPPGVAWIVHAGHAAKVAISRSDSSTAAATIPAPKAAARPVGEEQPADSRLTPLPPPPPAGGSSPAAEAFSTPGDPPRPPRRRIVQNPQTGDEAARGGGSAGHQLAEPDLKDGAA